MTEGDLSRAAQVLLDMPAFHALWDEMEKQATSKCIFAPYDDHEARQAHAAEARAIISFRNKLKALAQGQANASGRQAPA